MTCEKYYEETQKEKFKLYNTFTKVYQSTYRFKRYAPMYLKYLEVIKKWKYLS